MHFLLALPKTSLHVAGAIGDMVKPIAGKNWGKALAEPCVPSNPRSASRDEVRALYLEAL